MAMMREEVWHQGEPSGSEDGKQTRDGKGMLSRKLSRKDKDVKGGDEGESPR